MATFYYYEFDRVPDGDPVTDLANLEAAWNRVVQRHPMLRMVVGQDARQQVLSSVPRYDIAPTDLRDAGDEDAEAALAELRRTCSHQVRPVDRWPLFDIRAALLPDGRTRLFVGFDVLVLDLASWMQVMREWGRWVAEPAAALPPLPITFAELVRRRTSDVAERRRRDADLAYWVPRAPHLPSGPALPWMQEPVELGVPRFTRHGSELPAAEWTRLRDRAALRGLSPTGLLLAAFGLVLHRRGATVPFCLNATLFDRADAATGEEIPGLDGVVGDFTSTILVQMPDPALVTGGCFADYATAVNRQFWADLDHRSVSGIEVLREAHRDGTGPQGTGPLHPVVFTSGVGLAGAGQSPARWLDTEVFGVSQTPQVLLDHIVWDEGGRLRLACDAVDGALPEDFVPGMLAAHTRLLQRLADEEAAWTDPALGWDPSFLPDEDLETIPFREAGPLLDDPLRVAAAAAPGEAALLGAGQVVTHGELASRAGRTGATLAGLGLGPGDLVAVAAEKGVAQVTALLGISASGAGYVPVEPSWPAARVASVCEQAGVQHAVIVAGGQSTFPENVSVHLLDAEGVLEGAPGDPRRPQPGDLAYAIFTSGSTGRPKGVAIEHRAVRTTLDDLADRFPLHSADRVLALSAFSFDLSVYDIFSLLGAGGAVVLPDASRERDPGHWLELMRTHRVTVWNTAPALLEMLVEYAEIEPGPVREALQPLRLVLLSADWIPVTLPDRIRALAPAARVVSLGGATEASIWSICFPIGSVDRSWPSIPYGRALRGQSFHILDGAGQPAPVGGTGELHIGGEGLARGYVGDEAQTALRFVEHPVLRRRLYRTGDLGRWRPDGTIEFLGRLDRQVKIRGHRIELGEIESALDRAPEVSHCVARSVPGPDERPRLVAYIVPSGQAAPPPDEALIALLREQVPEFMVPSRFVTLAALPITANGKIDYGALPNPYRPGTASETTQALPPPGPAAVDVLDVALTEATARGLGLTLTVSAGRLAPVAALDGAAAWARTVRAATQRAGVSLAERLSQRGVLDLVLDATPAASAPAIPIVAAEPVPAPVTSAPATSARDIPDPQVERAIARVLADLLSGPVEVSTPFFRLGATSLTLVLAHRVLRAELDPGLAVIDLFAHPTVRDLARWITQRRDRQHVPAAAPAVVAVPASSPTGRRAARTLAAEVAR